MKIEVREMLPEEFDIAIRYFHEASPDFLDVMGVDPTKLHSKEDMQKGMERRFSLIDKDKTIFLVTWIVDDRPIGFSSLDNINFGESAYMHLHIVEEALRSSGIGCECVKLSTKIYFERFQLKKLFCQPNVLNTASNRTLQKTGFKYLQTYYTVPGLIHYRQAVTRWVTEQSL